MQRYILMGDEYFLIFQHNIISRNIVRMPPADQNKSILPTKQSDGRPLRAVRQSEPTLMVEDIINNVNRIREEHQARNNDKKRNPRLSQNQFNSPLPSNGARVLPADTSSHHHYFHSPPSYTEQRSMKKSPTAVILQNGLASPRFTKKTTSTAQMNIRKSPGKSNRESLNEIEEMLTSHGYSVTGKYEKSCAVRDQKSPGRMPRFSEPMMQNQQFQFLKKRKQNQSYGNTKGKIEYQNEAQKFDSKDLKETMSSSSSYKKIKPMKISDFELGRQLGKGKFGRVKVARHKKFGMVFSLKIISKQIIKQENLIDQIVKEVKIQSFLNHSHIIKLFGVFDDRENVYLLLQFCSGGNLYQYMQKQLKIAQNEASSILKSVCEAVGQLHHHKIVHRDIKPENIVLCNGMAKICDFGWSTQIKNSMRETFCGTPLYVSPQLLSGQLYDEKVDLWAIGILGYEMMTGNIPFCIKTQRDLVKIIESKINYPRWLSPEAISFLKEMLEKDPRKRKTVEQLLNHEFICKKK